MEHHLPRLYLVLGFHRRVCRPYRAQSDEDVSERDTRKVRWKQ
jgi:transposase